MKNQYPLQEIFDIMNNAIKQLEKVEAKCNRSDLTKFIEALDNKETEIGGGEGIIRTESDVLYFNFEVKWGSAEYETTINSVDYTNVDIWDKEGESILIDKDGNDIQKILEGTDFDIAFQSHIIDNLYLIKPKI